MIRVVLDTNVVVSGLLWSGAPQEIIVLAGSKVELVTSEILIDELRDVLQRAKFAKRLGKLNKSADNLIESYLKIAQIIQPSEVPAGSVADPDDEAVLACGVGGEAQYIVSGDQHLLILGNFANIAIVAPTELLSQLN